MEQVNPECSKSDICTVYRIWTCTAAICERHSTPDFFTHIFFPGFILQIIYFLLCSFPSLNNKACRFPHYFKNYRLCRDPGYTLRKISEATAMYGIQNSIQSTDKSNLLLVIKNSLFANRSCIHLLICAIHSAFSVLVAAYTANDFFALMICHPFFKS